MDEQIIAPVYSQIALDIALRISRGELKENTKIYGRSVMASEYGVSPETIRRAMKLLEDMDIVEIRHKSGSLIISADKANEYVQKFSERNNIRTFQKRLHDLLLQQGSLYKQISETVDSIVRINEKFSKSTPFTNYEAYITENSPLIGQSLASLNFWQQTTATVIAIRRDDKIILSPGPYAILQAEDTLVYIGDVSCVEAVSAFIKG